jgi:hypothetical protein
MFDSTAATQRMRVLQTRRLMVRHFERADAPFILELLNEPSWLQFIGDKGIKTLADAERYIQDVLVAMYARLGFGLYLVESTDSGESLGMCGLIKRDSLQDVDLGFAFLRLRIGAGSHVACETASRPRSGSGHHPADQPGRQPIAAETRIHTRAHNCRDERRR